MENLPGLRGFLCKKLLSIHYYLLTIYPIFALLLKRVVLLMVVCEKGQSLTPDSRLPTIYRRGSIKARPVVGCLKGVIINTGYHA
jgi:hypothetical protein